MLELMVGLVALASSRCATDAQGYCIDKVVRAEIGYGAGQAAVRINCALGDVVSIALPEGVEVRGAPALGNQATFESKVQTEPFRVLVWPKAPAGAQNVAPTALLGERSNLQIFLDSGVTVLVDLKIGLAEKSVQDLRLEFPEREKESAFVRARMDAFARKLEDEYQAKTKALQGSAEELARRRVARAMLERVQCASLSERRMIDLLVLRAQQICRIGDLMFVQFSVKNRARDLFHMGGVQIAVAGGEAGEGEIESVVEYSGETMLPFDHEVRGVLTFAVGDSAKTYAVTVRESGGKKRVVEVDHVEF